MPRKNTTGRKKPARKPTIKQPAQAIVDSPKYDSSTRESIRFQLEANDPELAEFVKRAEQGEIICDTTNPRVDRAIADLSSNRKRLASAILEILTNDETPNELQDRVEEFVVEAGSGSIRPRWTLPGSLAALEHLLTFVEWKAREEVSHAK